MESDWVSSDQPDTCSSSCQPFGAGTTSPLSSLPSVTKTQLLPLFLAATFDICNNFHKIEIFV